MPYVRQAQSKSPNFQGEMVQIEVGSPPTKLYIHRNIIITASSPFRSKALSGSWTEAESGVVKLPMFSAENFARYIGFLYTGKVITETVRTPNLEEPRPEFDVMNQEWQALLAFYYLAEYVLDESARNIAIDALIERFEEDEFFCGNLTANVYQQTTDGSPLRKFFVDLHIWKDLGQYLDCRGEAPIEFYQDVGKEFSDARGEPWESGAEYPWTDRCRYHVHTTEKARSSCQGSSEDCEDT